ncbi:MAG: flavin reductase [Clostridia bacterium]|nr:flavin reductase [Clostridia bacterium]
MDKKALFNIGYGLYILTSADNGKQNGCIINTVMQITSNPISILIGVNKDSYTHDMIMKSKAFNISILTEKVPFSVFQNFGFYSGRNYDKFIASPYYATAANGIYCVTQYANSVFLCKTTENFDMGTHTLFKATVEDAIILNDEPSVTYSYYQKYIKPKPNTTDKHGYRCMICGYEHISDTLPDDFICPICKHGASDFVKF